MNLLKTNKYFTSKILLILELTFPSKLSEKRIWKPQNHAFLTLTISYCFLSIFGSVKMWKQVFVSNSSQENIWKRRSRSNRSQMWEWKWSTQSHATTAFCSCWLQKVFWLSPLNFPDLHSIKGPLKWRNNCIPLWNSIFGKKNNST